MSLKLITNHDSKNQETYSDDNFDDDCEVKTVSATELETE